MAVAKPAARPNITKAEVARILAHRKQDARVVLIGIRGYYQKMGKPGRNDRGIYDDAIIVVETREPGNPENWIIHTYNANTDPTKYRDATPERKGMATLCPGTWTYHLGQHGISRGNPYPALVQTFPVDVTRDGATGKYNGMHMVNIHKGSHNSTSSEGCQTVHPDQWAEFLNEVTQAMKRWKVTRIKYELMDEVDRRKFVEHIPG